MKTTKPNKQHKRLYQAPLHKRYKQFSASLSTKLKESHNANSIPVRLGDTVQIMRGDRKGFEGKITKVDRAAYRISVEGVTREKVDGTTTPISIHPSKVRITQLNLDDKRRREALKRKGIGEKAELLEMRVTEETETKPARKTRKRKKKTSQQTKADTKKRSPKKKVEKST
ncbi:MAG: 50S ribosomal protein L24 [Candidatus Bathyarchaeota archaeon]|nr:MAG: 50S ribosomal protein L24 [Candidatus Bathyarchaeota archaeon]